MAQLVTTTDLIRILQKIEAEHGPLPIFVNHEDEAFETPAREEFIEVFEPEAEGWAGLVFAPARPKRVVIA